MLLEVSWAQLVIRVQDLSCGCSRMTAGAGIISKALSPHVCVVVLLAGTPAWPGLPHRMVTPF